MNVIHRSLGIAAAAALGVASSFALPLARASAGLPVFDVANYTQNILIAARALQQINNQVQSLQNELAMLRNMQKNLQTIDFPQLGQISAAMQQVNKLMSDGRGIEFRVAGLDREMQALFPGALRNALTSNERLANARSQLDAATAAYRQAMTVQASVAENVGNDAEVLSELATRSQGAVGALQAAQAANQLMALSIKQQLQLQNLMAAEFREAAIDRARRAQAEEDGRVLTRRFIEGPAAPGN